MSKYKQFWIDFKIGENDSAHQLTDVSMVQLGHPFKNSIHVIEHRALVDAQNLIREAEILLYDVRKFTDAYKAPETTLELLYEFNVHGRASKVLEKLKQFRQEIGGKDA